MTTSTALRKIKHYEDLIDLLASHRSAGQKIVHCHGVFDLVHPGHIRHFRSAKAQGDLLVVSVTPDRFVNKGPGRPVFTENLRLEALAALEDIDYVVLNDSPDAISAIHRIQPHLYVKGSEYQNHSADVTGKISEEAKAVEAIGGALYYTHDIVFSSSSLLNRHFESHSQELIAFIDRLKKELTREGIVEKIDTLSSLKVLVIGDAIVDEYQYTAPLGQSGKGYHMVARCLEKEVFLGGSLIVANHLAQFAGQVTLATALGKVCPYLKFIQQNLDPRVDTEIAYLEETQTLTKKRYVLKDGPSITKLFETYSGHEDLLDPTQTQAFAKFLETHARNFDLVLVCDFGNGFTNPALIQALCDLPSFLALNTQTNSGNRGYNVITNYRRADYISLNEPELRLSTHDRTSSLEGLASDICEVMHCKTISITRGVHGVFCFSPKEPSVHIPALATTSVDRIGAGDSYLALSSLSLARGFSPSLSAFIGSAAAALSVQMIGNQEPIRKASLCKFLTRLLK